MKLLLLVTFTLLFNTNAYASCQEEYQLKIRHYDSLLSEPLKKLTITAASSAVSLPLMAATGLLSLGTTIPIVAALFGVGSYYSYLKIRQQSYRKVLILLKQAESIEGKYLRRLQRYLDENTDRHLTLEDTANLLLDANNQMLICPYDIDRDKRKIMTIRKLSKVLLTFL